MPRKKKPNVQDEIDRELIANASEYTAVRMFNGIGRQKIGPFPDQETLKRSVAEHFARDDFSQMTTNNQLKPFAVYAVTYVHSYPYTTHLYNLERKHVEHLQHDPGGDQDQAG